jgi:CheY-like chemotaxis protein
MSEHAVILVAEDREDDIYLILRAFERAQVLNPIHVVRDGEEAITYLKGEGKFANRAEYPLPELLLLDLKMPRADGFEVLRWVRAQPELKALRVIVLTSSEDIRDVNRAYELGANSFLVKPGEFERFVDLSHALSGYWIWVNRAPEISRPNGRTVNSLSLVQHA